MLTKQEEQTALKVFCYKDCVNILNITNKYENARIMDFERIITNSPVDFINLLLLAQKLANKVLDFNGATNE